MATVIPVQGEMEQVVSPESLLGADSLIIRSVPAHCEYTRIVWIAGNGEAFLYCDPSFVGPRITSVQADELTNRRASKFMEARGLHGTVVYGSALYLSVEEWQRIHENERTADVPLVGLTGGSGKTQDAFVNAYIGTPTPPAMVPVSGNTYPVKEQLKALGGKWDANVHSWMVPADKEAEARTIVAGAPKTQGRNWSPNRRGAPQGPGVSAPAHEANGTPRLNKIAGRCHLCRTPLGPGEGSLFYSAPGAAKGGGKWLIECLPADVNGCLTRRGLPPVEPPAPPDLVEDEGVADIIASMDEEIPF